MIEINKNLFFLIIIIFVFSSLPIQQSLAWGSITHMAINKEAYEQVVSGNNWQEFIMAGQNADMTIFFFTKAHPEITFTDFYYAHDLILFSGGLARLLDADKDGNSKGDSTFGKLMVKAFLETRHPERFTEKDKFYAYGWLGHQLGDRQAHGTKGYISNVGGKKLHLIREGEVDSFIYNKYRDNQEFLNQLKASPSTKLIHEASIKAYNFLRGLDGNRIVDRHRDLLICKRVETIAKWWSWWLAAYQKSISKWATVDRFLGFEPPAVFYDYYNASVNDIAKFLEDPRTDIPEDTLSLKDRLKNLADRFLTYFKVQPALAEQEELISREVFYQFFFDLAERAEQSGALRTTETIIDQGLPTERVEYASQIVDEAGFDNALQETIDEYKSNQDEKSSEAIMGRYVDNLINHPELSFDEALNQALNIDQTPPVIVINSPEARDYLHSENLTINFSVTDEESGVASTTAMLNDELVAQGQSIDLSLKPLGQYVFKVPIQDQAGNSDEKIVNFQIIATISSLIKNVNHYADLSLIKNRGIKFSLLTKLHLADFFLKFDKEKPAIRLLNSFIKEVQVLKGKLIDPLAADLLTVDVQYIISSIH